MKKIIKGKSYDTETAKEIGSITIGRWGDYNWYDETLYQKKTGEFFIYGHGGANSKYGVWVADGKSEGKKIIPIGVEAADEWSQENLDGDTYEKVFGEVTEDSAMITLRTTTTIKEKFDNIKKEKNMNASELLEFFVNNN
ncbi:hypothetical protein [Pseudolactococcus carnosus]|uniref:Phage protein n=1 Tax=Pseudolactococcus carnosus TaxID=2749961 RepID=A0ABT0ARY9_9LACT|nr:hypothetical protein [Lactococcus carnosus]MCJ1989389.1 hypothetical protein [Lactococcus carnosus]